MKLLEFLQEENGGLSATRLGFLLWVIGVLIVWMINSIVKQSLLPIDGSVATILGILMMGRSYKNSVRNQSSLLHLPQELPARLGHHSRIT